MGNKRSILVAIDNTTINDDKFRQLIKSCENKHSSSAMENIEIMLVSDLASLVRAVEANNRKFDFVIIGYALTLLPRFYTDQRDMGLLYCTAQYLNQLFDLNNDPRFNDSVKYENWNEINNADSNIIKWLKKQYPNAKIIFVIPGGFLVDSFSFISNQGVRVLSEDETIQNIIESVIIQTIIIA